MSREEALIEAAENAESETASDKVTNHFLKKGYTGLLQLGRMFRRMDNDGKGTLTVDEMKDGFTQEGLELSSDEIQELLTDHDTEGDGNINYEEFLSAIRPGMDQARMDVVNQAFAKLDESGNGVVTVEDIRDKFSASSHPSVLDGSENEDDVFARFISRFEGTTSQDGKITPAEFMDYYAGISKSIDDDSYFIEVVKSTWGL